MKTVNGLIGIGLLCLVHATSQAASLDIPADYKAHANQVEFLSHLANRCDTRLSVCGKDGLNDPICKDFLAKLRGVMEVDPTTQQRWTTGVSADHVHGFGRFNLQNSDE